MRDKNRRFALERVRTMRRRLEEVEEIFERPVTDDDGLREAADGLAWVNNRSGVLASALRRLLQRRGPRRARGRRDARANPSIDELGGDEPSRN